MKELSQRYYDNGAVDRVKRIIAAHGMTVTERPFLNSFNGTELSVTVKNKKQEKIVSDIFYNVY